MGAPAPNGDDCMGADGGRICPILAIMSKVCDVGEDELAAAVAGRWMAEGVPTCVTWSVGGGGAGGTEVARCISGSEGGAGAGGVGVNGGLTPAVELGRGSQALSSNPPLASALAGALEGLLTRGVPDLVDSEGLAMADMSTEAGTVLAA